MSDRTRTDIDTALRRLLGPAGPELDCEQCFEHLDRYVELQIAGAGADEHVPGMRAHLQGCTACGEEHASLHALVAGEHGATRAPAGGEPSAA